MGVLDVRLFQVEEGSEGEGVEKEGGERKQGRRGFILVPKPRFKHLY